MSLQIIYIQQDVILNKQHWLICYKTQPNLYIYIYIVIHRQTVLFYQNSSVWLDMQDARSQDQNPSNFTLGLRPLGHQADYVG